MNFARKLCSLPVSSHAFGISVDYINIYVAVVVPHSNSEILFQQTGQNLDKESRINALRNQVRFQANFQSCQLVIESKTFVHLLFI